MPPKQTLLKQQDRKFSDLKTIREQARLLKGTVLTYQRNIEKQEKAYVDWCKKNDLDSSLK
jgi:hypothetical protein